MLNIICHCNQTAEMIAMETSYSTKALLIFFPSRLSFISHKVSEKKIYEYFFVLLTFWLPWQPAKLWNLHEIQVVGRVLLKKRFCKSFVKISAVT